ncbi:MAG: DNA replication and repair protein RecF [Tannerella sp.]|jgi:DNA replication and repair protein RecF|nr:DNA replication and repair protein RecF [Tannerella sp.]
MIIKKLSVLNYKNISQVEVECSSGLNCFFGKNGMGKTNLLDALYYLSFCKSHLNTPDARIIRYGEEMCVLQGLYDFDGREEEVFCAIRQGHRKQFKRNKKEYDRLSEHIGLLPLVMISPLDADLIRGGSDERRRFIDMLISQNDRQYLSALIHYNKALLQRNTMLRDRVAAADYSVYDVLEMQMATYGQTLYDKRRALLAELTPLFNEYYALIAGAQVEPVALEYRSHLSIGADFARSLHDTRERDLIIGYSTFGIHKDDVEMKLGDELMRRTGSQGQNKTYVIALKLAQFSLMNSKGGTKPILLLDDVFDKLDADRVEKIIGLVSSARFGQIFLTDTNRKYLDRILASVGGDYALFDVESGVVTN